MHIGICIYCDVSRELTHKRREMKRNFRASMITSNHHTYCSAKIMTLLCAKKKGAKKKNKNSRSVRAGVDRYTGRAEKKKIIIICPWQTRKNTWFTPCPGGKSSRRVFFFHSVEFMWNFQLLKKVNDLTRRIGQIFSRLGPVKSLFRFWL